MSQFNMKKYAKVLIPYKEHKEMLNVIDNYKFWIVEVTLAITKPTNYLYKNY